MPSALVASNFRTFVSPTKKLSEFSAEACKVADAALDSLLSSSDLVRSQWADLWRPQLQSGELNLLWWIFISAWEDLASDDYRVRAEAARFFTNAEAGEPVSLRFLCDVFELDVRAVQTVARVRIETDLARNGCRNRTRRQSAAGHRPLAPARHVHQALKRDRFLALGSS